MGRASYTSVIDHTTDVGFRAWAKQLSDAIKATGLVQTTDTGQVDWTLGTQAKPATNVVPYYEMYRFDDALQATSPVFLKVEYGSGNSVSRPAIKISVGFLGTDGAGVLTGTAAQPALSRLNNVSPDALPTFVCYKDGLFTLAWQVTSAISFAGASVVVGRTCDSAGASTGDGILVTFCDFSFKWLTWSYELSAGSAAIGAFTTVGVPCLTTPFANSATGAVVNLYNWYINCPNVFNAVALCSYKNAEMTVGTEFDAALVGGASRHYVALGLSTPGASSQALTGDTLAVLWEA